MKDVFFQATSYLQYWLLKEDHYSQQSPSIFSTYRNLLSFLSENKSGDPEIEKIRAQFLKDSSKIKVLDLGAGSKKVPQTFREIRKITKYSTSSPQFCQVYQFFCNLTPGNIVLELGTCMGMSTRYLAKSTKSCLYTFEGSPEILQASQKHPFPSCVKLVLGPIRQTLPEVLKKIPQVDFVLIDATHTEEATLEYFDLVIQKSHPKSILAIADIHWSREMAKAWKTIQKHPNVQLTLDFFECGIVFCDSPTEKRHLVLEV